MGCKIIGHTEWKAQENAFKLKLYAINKRYSHYE